MLKFGGMLGIRGSVLVPQQSSVMVNPIVPYMTQNISNKKRLNKKLNMRRTAAKSADTISPTPFSHIAHFVELSGAITRRNRKEAIR